jgi:hypothetical protein
MDTFWKRNSDKKNITFSKEAKNYFNRKRNYYILILNIKTISDRISVKKIVILCLVGST